MLTHFFYGARNKQAAVVAPPPPPPPPPPFSPIDDPTIFGWFESDTGLWADTAGTVAAAAGGSVARWDNQVPAKAHLLQATASWRPVKQNAGFNAKPAVLFDPTGSLPRRLEALLTMTEGSTTALIVFRRTSALVANARLLTALATGTNDDTGSPTHIIHHLTLANGARMESYRGGVTLAGAAIVDGTGYVARSTVNAGTHSYHMNGVQSGVDVATSVQGFNATEWRLGALSLEAFHGQVGAVFLFNGQPGAQYILNLTSYAMVKYLGLAPLPGAQA